VVRLLRFAWLAVESILLLSCRITAIYVRFTYITGGKCKNRQKNRVIGARKVARESGLDADLIVGL